MTERAIGPRSTGPATMLVIAIVAALDTVVFIFDVRSPPELHEWLFYLGAVMVCLFAPRAWVPLVAAAAASVLLALGVQHSPSAVDSSGTTNRVIGGAVIWILSIIGSRFIASRNRIQIDHWLKDGHSRLAETMQDKHDRQELATRVLVETCRRLGAQTGALFVSRDAVRYELAGGYALSPGRIKEAPAFKTGEGIVGQVARERRMLRISDVPAGYADVSSGLGAAPPRELLVAPLSADGAVTGVLELGFTRRPSALCEAYLEAVGDLIGAAFRAAQYEENLHELLETSRVQTAELQQQHEELQQINEELAQQSTALQASNVKLEEQQAELEQTNQLLGEQAEELRQQQALLAATNTELVGTQQRLEVKAGELDRAGRYKSEFLANMSHELRTPLNSALILARLLADNRAGNLTIDQVKYAEIIHQAGIDLLNLINDVLDISKVEAGRMEVQPTSFTLAEVAAAIDSTFQPLAAAKGLALTVSANSERAELHTDRGRLDQILRNLVANAVKFTERGSVTVGLELEPDGEHAVFRVVDTGIGIPTDQRDRIFEAFYQVEANGGRPGGTGLGLSIARRLAALLGGELSMSSTLGEGSVFTLRLSRALSELPTPVREAMSVDYRSASRELVIEPSPHRGPAAVPSFADDRGALVPSRRTVLVIEDDERFAFVLYKLVRELEHQCLTAITGGDGLALAIEYQPDAVILDLKLPDQSGLAVLDQLKALPRTRHIPVHVLSILDCEQTALEMGAVSYMLKPAKREEIVRTLSELAARSRQSMKKVLVVEDNAAQRDAIHALIAQDDVEIVVAQTAAEALEHLGQGTFDCVILDLGLPDMSGFELVERMAAGARFAHPPVIIYTGRNLSPSEEERLQRYARTIVLKGARSPDRLLHEVTLFLHKVEEQMPPAHQRLLAELRTRDRALEGKLLLVVDDDARNVYALTRVLEDHRAQVRIARNGREALDELERDPAIDLVLMDIMMPVMDGHEAIQRIRAQHQFRHLPIIALTARAMPDDHERCLHAGANDYLSKPVEVDRLLALLRVWTGQRRNVFH